MTSIPKRLWDRLEETHGTEARTRAQKAVTATPDITPDSPRTDVSQTALVDLYNHYQRQSKATTRAKRTTAALKIAGDIYAIRAGTYFPDGDPVWQVPTELAEAAYAWALLNDAAPERDTPYTEANLHAAAISLYLARSKK